ncbi:hypothetical protein ACWCSD_52925, partial [Nonomuraea sp. NPDC001684]
MTEHDHSPALARRTVDPAEAARMYRAGQTLTDIGSVHRALRHDRRGAGQQHGHAAHADLQVR